MGEPAIETASRRKNRQESGLCHHSYQTHRIVRYRDRAPRIGSAVQRETIQARYQETPFWSLGREGAMSDNSRFYFQMGWICKHWPTYRY
jgi:hypothetical protein